MWNSVRAELRGGPTTCRDLTCPRQRAGLPVRGLGIRFEVWQATQRSQQRLFPLCLSFDSYLAANAVRNEELPRRSKARHEHPL